MTAFSSTLLEKACWFSILFLSSTSLHKLPYLGVGREVGEEILLLADSLWFSHYYSMGTNICADFQLDEKGACNQK